MGLERINGANGANSVCTAPFAPRWCKRCKRNPKGIACCTTATTLWLCTIVCTIEVCPEYGQFFGAFRSVRTRLAKMAGGPPSVAAKRQ